MNNEPQFPTVKPVELTVKPAPKNKRRGYTICHNQKIGWAGTLADHFAWYKYKEDAVKQAASLQDSYNSK